MNHNKLGLTIGACGGAAFVFARRPTPVVHAP